MPLFDIAIILAASFSLAELRAQMPAIVVGFILLLAGVAAAVLFFFRRRSQDLTLIYLSLFSILYATRLLIRVPLVRSLAGISEVLRWHLDIAITFAILIPFLLFLGEVRGSHLKPVKPLIRILVFAQALFAAVVITSDFFGVGQSLAYSINNYLVLVIVGGLTLRLLFYQIRGLETAWTGEMRVVTIGLLVFSAFVIEGNVASLISLHAPNIEALGFLFFIGCLGYVAVNRAFANEHRLLALNKELEIARQIQSSILPREVPRVPGLEIAARYLPMSAVAGDFYDFLTLEGKQVGILVADVTGHGVPAALIASMLKVAFAGQKAHTQYPELVLTGLNEALCGKFEAHFVTAAYLYADLDAKIVRYAGAGHPPLLVRSAGTGEVRAIEQNGFFLGMFPEATYSSIEISLQRGDRYVLYTDGLPESANAKAEEFGLPRCMQFLGSHSNLPAATTADELLAEIARWSARSSRTQQADDMTLVVMDCER